MNSSLQSTNNFDGLEFEFTDLDSARNALDELPAGVEQIQGLRPGYWEQRRRGALPTDRALAGFAMSWLTRLPPEVRPDSVVERFPRVVNQLAESWDNAHACQHVFEQLLEDKRGGRRGFPFAVEAELRSLRRYRASLGR